MYSTQMLLAANVEDMSSEDEMDELFTQLLQIEPPATLVDNILAAVAGLPLPQEMNSMAWEDVEGLVANHEVQRPS